MNLLVDIGNSRLKWAIEREGDILNFEALDYRQEDFLACLRQRWQALEAPDQLALASVAQPQVAEAVMTLAQSLWPQQLSFVRPHASRQAFGVVNAYAQAETLGLDRWLAMLAAYREYPGGVCVIDCGTAITVDVVHADGRHAGGLICPGLQAMKQALAVSTAALTVDGQMNQLDLAANTRTAIANGVLLAAVGLIETVIQRFAAQCHVVLTGGDSRLLADALTESVDVDGHLVLKGLALYCTGVCSS